jgi:hypothetical protein
MPARFNCINGGVELIIGNISREVVWGYSDENSGRQAPGWKRY